MSSRADAAAEGEGEPASLDVRGAMWRYSLASGLVWAAFAAVTYGSTYMLELGLSSMDVGVMLVAGNVHEHRQARGGDNVHRQADKQRDDDARGRSPTHHEQRK